MFIADWIFCIIELFRNKCDYFIISKVLWSVHSQYYQDSSRRSLWPSKLTICLQNGHLIWAFVCPGCSIIDPALWSCAQGRCWKPLLPARRPRWSSRSWLQPDLALIAVTICGVKCWIKDIFLLLLHTPPLYFFTTLSNKWFFQKKKTSTKSWKPCEWKIRLCFL